MDVTQTTCSDYKGETKFKGALTILQKTLQGTPTPGDPGTPQRMYRKDYLVLRFLAQKGFGYTKELAALLGRTARAVQHTLKKLEDLCLIERHGQPRCPFQFFTIPKADIEEKARIHNLIADLEHLFTRKRNKDLGAHVLISSLLFDVRRRSLPERNDVERPQNASVPYDPKEHKLLKDFYAFLGWYKGYKSPLLPDVVFFREGRHLYGAWVKPVTGDESEYYRFWARDYEPPPGSRIRHAPWTEAGREDIKRLSWQLVDAITKPKKRGVRLW